MASETALINAALRLIGGKRITSRTSGTTEANVANDLFDIVRDDVLRAHPWNFATKRVELARSGTAPDFEFDYAYVLPTDWMRTVSAHDNDAGTGTLVGREELVNDQNVIVTSAENVYLRYVARITDTNRWPADFGTAVIRALARDMAIPIANSNAVFDAMDAAYKTALRKAKSSDALGSLPESRPRGSWVTARGGWNSGSL